MLPYIALWLATVPVAYCLFYLIFKRLGSWRRGDVVYFTLFCVGFGPVALFIALKELADIFTAKLRIRKALSDWAGRLAKW
jgi:hypothetical protein